MDAASSREELSSTAQADEDATTLREELSSTAQQGRRSNFGMELYGAFAAAPQADETEDLIFRKYYTDKDYFLSPEGLLKVLSAIVCIVSSVLFLSAGTCPGAPELVTSAATVALVCSVVTALIYAGVVLNVPLYAPQAFLFGDIVISTVMGVLLLITAVLSMTVCEFNTVVSYMHGPLAILNAGMVTASAVITYVAVMRLWDAAHLPLEPQRPPPTEQEV